VSDADLKSKTGRADAAFEDSKWLSKEGEWFLAGVLDGLTDVVPLVRAGYPLALVYSNLIFSTPISLCLPSMGTSA